MKSQILDMALMREEDDESLSISKEEEQQDRHTLITELISSIFENHGVPKISKSEFLGGLEE